MAVVLIFVPRPSLSLHPSYGVSLGDDVTVRCRMSHSPSRVWLYRGVTSELYRTADTERDTAEFSLLNVIPDNAMTYRCRYKVLGSGQTSELSDPVELVAIDHSYPKPGIALSPAGRVGSGSNVTIRCQGRDYGGPTLLYKDGSSAPIQRRDPDVGGTAVFTLFGVTPADGGTYRCSYRIGGCCSLSSPLGDNVTLEVVPQGDGGELRWTPPWTVVGGCVAAFVITLIFVVSFLLAARRRRMQRTGSPGGEKRFRSPDLL
ncbi:hypothetical protein ASZ78_001107 [Callipepla squamata]|uniref:Ig-like domain-containing protein n=1 Tax=Callipepla squamata TaxID=9009 RepID=A0A226MC52_CALSU|nr:hypothetical protein ASZ78_001107 [Callipepla squamata]